MPPKFGSLEGIASVGCSGNYKHGTTYYLFCMKRFGRRVANKNNQRSTRLFLNKQILARNSECRWRLTIALTTHFKPAPLTFSFSLGLVRRSTSKHDLITFVDGVADVMMS
mmetsp:Transcript_11847/g.24424  ORF Transcript_11847/g.24424 Transcript_11847/m.24424 type:complete len:111 (-) Transcript_11847:141-473(-)